MLISLVITTMKDSYMFSKEGRETFTEHQIEQMKSAITNAVGKIIVEQCSTIESDVLEPEQMRRIKDNAQ